MKKNHEWVVIGAGPAGIAAIGKLLDSEVPGDSIVWIDPAFQVGDFGTLWTQISSNTTAELFIKFYKACQSFQFQQRTHPFPIEKIPPKETCLLKIAAEPLYWITKNLLQQVNSIKDLVSHIAMENNQWKILLKNNTHINAKNIILATGAEPRSLQYPNLSVITLENAFNENYFNKEISPSDRVAVFGSSHSAIILLKKLIELDVEVINFYRQPLRYAVYFDDWILFDDTGLKGKTAEWARNNLHGLLPKKLLRVLSSEENIKKYLPICNKAIYAIGFKKRAIAIADLPHNFEHNPHCGIIAPSLFGVGIAFPEAKIDRFGTLEYRVGLWKFMEYLGRVFPVWMRYKM